MEQYIQISTINDFLYSPQSLYLHSIYQSFHIDIYHSQYQTNGKGHHKTLDEKTYSGAQRYIQAIPVYSEEYHIIGKIDLYDIKTQTLIERKAKIKNIYSGHKYQLYAQMFCLQEMGYIVKKLKVHSIEDNKRYTIDLPTPEDIVSFRNLIRDIFLYNPLESDITLDNRAKTEASIYKELIY